MNNDNPYNHSLLKLSVSACEIPQADIVSGLQRDMRVEGLEDSL